MDRVWWMRVWKQISCKKLDLLQGCATGPGKRKKEPWEISVKLLEMVHLSAWMTRTVLIKLKTQNFLFFLKYLFFFYLCFVSNTSRFPFLHSSQYIPLPSMSPCPLIPPQSSFIKKQASRDINQTCHNKMQLRKIRHKVSY